MITVMLMNVHKNVVAGIARVVTFVPISSFYKEKSKMFFFLKQNQ